MEQQMIKRTRFPQLFLGLAAALPIACHTSAPVAQAAAPAKAPDAAALLSQQNVDATIYQNASAEVYRLYQQGYELARIRLDANLQRPHTLPPAVIVDIDETVLDNSPSNVTDIVHGRTYVPAEWKKWTNMASAKALPGAVEFLNYAAGRGCAVYYISNRDTDEKQVTVKNLRSAGFPMADSAHVMLMEGTSDKTERRATVAKDHYIALLVGDQLTDFDQRLKDRSQGLGRRRVDELRDTLERYFIMLPNSMYGTWLDAISGRPDTVKPGNKARFLQRGAY
jgi:5'-nucleotidase (lipoprotein e(P4) family)